MSESDSERTLVTLTWWSASGLQRREVEIEEIEDVEVPARSGSKNPFTVKLKGELQPRHCRSIEWPENRCVVPKTDFCDFCKQEWPESKLVTVYTVMNEIEAKERVCPNCEDEAREYEKPVATDGGTTVRKRKSVPSVLVDCEDCEEPFEITARDFDLAHEVDPDPSFRCNDCQLHTGNERDDLRTDGGKYVVETGEGYLGIFAVRKRHQRGLTAQITAGPLREIGIEAGDEVSLYDHEHGIVVTGRDYRGEHLRDFVVTDGCQFTVNDWLLDQHLGIDGETNLRGYRHRGGMLLVDADDDPRVQGGDSA